MKKTSFAFTALAIVALAGSANAASFVTGSLAAWERSFATWGETSYLGYPNGSWISGFRTSDGVNLSVNSAVHQVGDGWETWSGGYLGQVITDYDSCIVAFTVNSPVRGFGFFVEPDPSNIVEISLTTSNGLVLTQAVNGVGGAKFFGWVGPGVSSFRVTSPQEFAVGEFFSAPVGVPEPTAWATMLFGLGAVGAAARASRLRRAPARIRK